MVVRLRDIMLFLLLPSSFFPMVSAYVRPFRSVGFHIYNKNIGQRGLLSPLYEQHQKQQNRGKKGKKNSVRFVKYCIDIVCSGDFTLSFFFLLETLKMHLSTASYNLVVMQKKVGHPRRPISMHQRFFCP